MHTISLQFPDEETKAQFERWWAYYGKSSCHKFVEGSLQREEAPWLYTTHDNNPDVWVFSWDVIPF